MEIVSRSASETIKIGRLIAKKLKRADIICLFGQLGSGKTVLTKGIARGLGISADKITSPSFVLIRQYASARLPFFHFDLYRLKTAGDIFALGYEEYLYDEGVSVVEWADRLGRLLPAEYLKINFFIKSDSRRLLKLTAFGARYRELLQETYEDIRH